MTDHIDTLREDIAFIRSVADDDGRIPSIVGANFLAVGLIYGLPIVLAWATLTGLVDLPRAWTSWVAVWSTAIYLPVSAVLARGLRGWCPGPSVRAVASIWSGVALASLLIVICIFIGGARLGVPEAWQFWPPICFVIYGSAWLAMSIARRSGGWFLVALGSYATAVVNALLVGGPNLLLGMGAGLVVWLSIPGLVMMARGRRAESE